MDSAPAEPGMIVTGWAQSPTRGPCQSASHETNTTSAVPGFAAIRGLSRPQRNILTNVMPFKPVAPVAVLNALTTNAFHPTSVNPNSPRVTESATSGQTTPKNTGTEAPEHPAHRIPSGFHSDPGNRNPAKRTQSGSFATAVLRTFARDESCPSIPRSVSQIPTPAPQPEAVTARPAARTKANRRRPKAGNPPASR